MVGAGRAQDGPTVCGPEVEVAAQVTLGSEAYTFHGRALLTHAYAGSWLIVGPFPNGGNGFDTVFPPEQG